jgi:hypothetical protein
MRERKRERQRGRKRNKETLSTTTTKPLPLFTNVVLLAYQLIGPRARLDTPVDMVTAATSSAMRLSPLMSACKTSFSGAFLSPETALVLL